MSQWILLLTVLLSMAAMVSCAGYAHEELFPQQVRTVAVDIFDNRTFYQGVEFDLTEALVKEIEFRTPYKVVDKQGADTLISGTITTVNQNVLSRVADGGVPQEMQVTVIASFEWKDARSGEIVRARDSIHGTGQYIPANNLPDSPVGEAYPTAQHEAAAELAREIVSVMREDW